MTIHTGNDWQTPDWFLDLVREVAPIRLDPCTGCENPTGAEYIRTINCDPDGLATNWSELAPGGASGLVFVNPPYGRGHMGAWAQKVCWEALRGCEVIALVRGDTSTQWAHQMLRQCDAVCFPPRIKFKGATGSPNFANTVLYFGEHPSRFSAAFEHLGPVLTP